MSPGLMPPISRRYLGERWVHLGKERLRGLHLARRSADRWNTRGGIFFHSNAHKQIRKKRATQIKKIKIIKNAKFAVQNAKPTLRQLKMQFLVVILGQK